MLKIVIDRAVRQEHIALIETSPKAAPMTFLNNGRYDLSAIVRDAHRRAKKIQRANQLGREVGRPGAISESYADLFAFYLRQVWITAQHEMRAARCTGETVTVTKAFDNGNSPLWRL
jgi:hypothetical protein